MEGASQAYKDLASRKNAELETLMKVGAMPSLDALAGFEFRGFNTPAFTAVLGIRKFVKGFFRSPRGLEGYNVPARQNGLDGEWLRKPSEESPKRFGFYVVTRSPGPYPNSALIDYSASALNKVWQPERLLRDYLVQPDPGNPDLFLGKAYLALPSRVHVSYFVLERLRATAWKP